MRDLVFPESQDFSPYGVRNDSFNLIRYPIIIPDSKEYFYPFDLIV